MYSRPILSDGSDIPYQVEYGGLKVTFRVLQSNNPASYAFTLILLFLGSFLELSLSSLSSGFQFWYRRAAVCLVDSSDAAPSSMFAVGDMVQLAEGFAGQSDAANGPLKPGVKTAVKSVNGQRHQIDVGGKKVRSVY